MATAIHRLGVVATRPCFRLPFASRYYRIKALVPSVPCRLLHKSPIRSVKNEDDEEDEDKDRSRQSAPEVYSFNVDSLDPAARAQYDVLSPEEKLDYQKVHKGLYDYMTSPKIRAELNTEVSQASHEIEREFPEPEIRLPSLKRGFIALGEDHPQDVGEDEEFQGDDITSLAHGELEQHREMREYARIAAWEMPMLSKLAKPFSPPPLDHPLRFRYTTYMGETHPAEKKIVLEFCTEDLTDLTEPQRIKLIKLLGPRYNPETDIVKMSCEMFETQAQNKRYLGDLVDTLMAEAKDSSDMFEDVPLDFRHHKFRRKLGFPEAWKLTDERKKQLEDHRSQNLLVEDAKMQAGQIVDGLSIIETRLKEEPITNPVRMPLPTGKNRGRGNKARSKINDF